MRSPTIYRKLTLASMVFLTVIFCLFTLAHEKITCNKIQKRLEKHARIISDDLWNFNTLGAGEYLRLAAEADHFEVLEVISHNGEVFQKVTTDPPTSLEKFLIEIRLIPQVLLVTPVHSKTNVIGWIEAIWLPQTLITQAYVFAFLLLVFLCIALYCKILEEKYFLEQRVIARTNELEETNKNLQQEYQERAKMREEKDKLHRRLEQSRKMESLGLLAGGVAHDLNNVLSGIVTYPDLLLMDLEKTSPMYRGIETIRNSGLRAAEIVQDLLSLARRGVMNRQILQLNNLIEQYLHSPEYKNLLAFNPNLEVTTYFDDSLAQVEGSEVALKKVIMNLVSNSAEAQPSGGTVTISTFNRILEKELSGLQTISPGKYVVVRVADEGEGISTQDMQRIFEPFYTRKMMGRSGTGLGLTVVWGTVEDHKGFIDMKSVRQQGTAIDIFLPATAEQGTAKKEPLPPAELLGNGEAILVVDDILEQREIALAILNRLNYNPVAVASGEEAVLKVKDEKYDLLILDMLLENGIDGLETYRRILEIVPQQKAIIASGYSETDRVRETQQLGAGSCIRKPYTIQQVSVAVWKELQDSKQPEVTQ